MRLRTVSSTNISIGAAELLSKAVTGLPMNRTMKSNKAMTEVNLSAIALFNILLFDVLLKCLVVPVNLVGVVPGPIGQDLIEQLLVEKVSAQYW